MIHLIRQLFCGESHVAVYSHKGLIKIDNKPAGCREGVHTTLHNLTWDETSELTGQPTFPLLPAGSDTQIRRMENRYS
jgi:hypothetical protein